MKKGVVLGMGLFAAFAFSSCKSSESAYKRLMKRQNSKSWLKLLLHRQRHRLKQLLR